jgi:hypothetical protein
VADEEAAAEASDGDSDDETEGTFFNDLYSVTVEGERATWHPVQLTGRREAAGDRRRRRRAKADGEDGVEETEEDEALDQMEDLALEGPAGTVTVESGAFTVSSTVTAAVVEPELAFLGALGAGGATAARELVTPSPRFNSGLVYKGGLLYLFGGLWEVGDKDYTLKDFYSLDTKKLDSWSVLIEDDVKTMEWVAEEEDEEEDGEDDDEDDESGMETD